MIMVILLNLIASNATDLFNFKAKITSQTDDNGRINNVEIMVPLDYLSNFWRIFETCLIHCEVNLILTWSENCVVIYVNVANQKLTLEIPETKLYVVVVILSSQDDAKLLPQLKSGLKK